LAYSTEEDAMAISLLLALLGLPLNPEIQVPSEPDLTELYNAWEDQKPERKELMMRLLYDVLHHSAMVEGEGNQFGRVLARILTDDHGKYPEKPDLNDDIRMLRDHMKQEIRKHLGTLRSAAQPPSGST
jgi:hypothetical protein